MPNAVQNLPYGALFVELLDLFVDEGFRVLALVLRPARLQEHAIGSVRLLAAASLRHLVLSGCDLD